MPTKRERNKRYPVEYAASELGVDRKTLVRRLAAASIDTSKGVTFREAFEAWTAKDERDADRAREQKAKADSAEVDAAEKIGALMFKKDAVQLWGDATIEVRKLIQSQDKWDAGKLLVALSKLKAKK